MKILLLSQAQEFIHVNITLFLEKRQGKFRAGHVLGIYGVVIPVKEVHVLWFTDKV